jgi:hypothetical protein
LPASWIRPATPETAPVLAQGGQAQYDALAAALRGPIAQGLGLPVDVEGFVRMLAEGDSLEHTAADVSTADVGAIVETLVALVAEKLGEFMPK